MISPPPVARVAQTPLTDPSISHEVFESEALVKALNDKETLYHSKKEGIFCQDQILLLLCPFIDGSI